MEIIDKKPIPIYEAICPECKSILQYKKTEVSFTGYITCPVCGVSVWANTIKPEKYIDNSEELLDNNAPMVDAVKHGHWAEHKDYPGLAYLCSKCNYFTTDRSYYCPYCGATMDEVEE